MAQRSAKPRRRRPPPAEPGTARGPKVVGSNPASATKKIPRPARPGDFFCFWASGAGVCPPVQAGKKRTGGIFQGHALENHALKRIQLRKSRGALCEGGERLEYLTSEQAAQKWGISVRLVQRHCAEGRVEGARKFGGTWAIPAKASKPEDPRRKGGSAAQACPPALRQTGLRHVRAADASAQHGLCAGGAACAALKPCRRARSGSSPLRSITISGGRRSRPCRCCSPI